MSNTEELNYDENEEVPVEGASDDDDTAQSEIEARARKQGWRPEEEWDEDRAARQGKSKPTKFFTAQEFLDRTEENLPILRERLRKNEKRGEDQDRTIKELRDMVFEQRNMNQQAVERARKAGRHELETELRSAAAEGDLDKHDEITKKISDLDEENRKAAAAEAEAEAKKTPAVDPKTRQSAEVTKRWVEQNGWFREPAKAHLNAAMIHEHQKVKNREVDMDEWESLDEAKRIVMQRYPEEFGKRPARGQFNSVETPNNRGQGAKSVESRFQALSKGDQDIYGRHKAMFEKQGAKYTKEEFLNEYGA